MFIKEELITSFMGFILELCSTYSTCTNGRPRDSPKDEHLLTLNFILYFLLLYTTRFVNLYQFSEIISLHASHVLTKTKSMLANSYRILRIDKLKTFDRVHVYFLPSCCIGRL